MSPVERSTSIAAIVFDMDGVLFDTEQVWHEVRRDFALSQGGHWTERDQRAVMGANSEQWSTYMHESCGIELAPPVIYERVVDELRRRYEQELIIYPAAAQVVSELAGYYPLAIASSSPRELIEVALKVSGLGEYFAVLVSSDEVSHGKPAPDVYLRACDQLGAVPWQCVAIEDSSNGIRAAAAAGLAVIAVPNPDFPPSAEVLGLATKVLDNLAELNVETVEAAGGGVGRNCFMGSAGTQIN